MASVYEEIDKYFETYRAEVFGRVGYEGMSDDELRQVWFDNYDWLIREIPGCEMREADDMIAPKALAVLEALLGSSIMTETNAAAIPKGSYLADMLGNFTQHEVSASDIAYYCCRLYGYAEMYTKGAALYDSDAFHTLLFEQYGYDKTTWDEWSEEQKLETAASIYADYIANSRYNKDGIYDGGNVRLPADKTYDDFSALAQDRYFELTDTSMAEVLGEFYLRVSTWMGGETQTDYKEFKIVGVFSDTTYDSLIVSDTFNDMYNEYCTENNFAKHERYPHETGSYAYALAVMPTDDDAVMRMVELSYDETQGLRFSLQNQVMDTLDNFNDFIEIGADIFLYIGIGFAVFSALMLMNFISVSISYKRREIGVLRAVGARSSDVFKIFFSEAFMIALINYILSIIATVTVINVFNTFVRNEGLNITLLNFGVRQVVLMFAVSLFVAAVASFLPVWNIARRKPVDAIKNK